MRAPRFDYCATVCFFHPLSRLRAPRRGGIPVLMYHDISESGRAFPHRYYTVHTHPAVFRRHMAILKERGYRALTLRDLPDELAADGPPPSDARVAITFDDGYRSVYEYAWPMLREAGFPATVYLPTDSIAAQRRRIHGIECLTWDEAAAMAAAGIEFGSHTVRHAPLADEPESAVQTELADSKAAIEEHLGRPVETFSYPYAFPEAARAFRSRLRDLLTRAGYRTAVTTLVGTVRPGDDLLCLKRLPVNTWDDDALFLAKLQGGYDWMHALQRAHKRLRRLKPGARPQARRAPAGAE